MKSKFQKILENAYENLDVSEDSYLKKKKQLINHIQELLRQGDPDNVLNGLSVEQLQNIYNQILKSHRNVEAAISDWEEAQKES